MKIHDIANFPNPLRVRIALAEKNATENVSFVPVDVMAGEHRAPEFIARNPAGGVPVLELDDGTFISECTAIIEYIDHTFEGPSLTGRGAKTRALISMMQRRAEFMVLDAVAAYFHHATDGLGPELEVYQNQAWGERQKEVALKGMAYFNKILADTDYVVGGEFTVADITLFAGLGFADFAAIDIPSECAQLIAWRARVASRPSVS